MIFAVTYCYVLRFAEKNVFLFLFILFYLSLWAALCSLLNIQHNQTTAYHPQSTGMVECFQSLLKDALHARCAAANWVYHLLWVLMGLCAAAREDDGSTHAQELFGSPLILPG